MKKALLFAVVLTASLISNAMTIETFVDEATGDISAKIDNPSHPGSNLPLSFYSDENGVCKVYGYEKAADSSRRYGAKADVLKVNAQGNIENGLNDYKLTSIVCLNQTGYTPNEISKFLGSNELKHANSGLPLSFYSDEDGVCKSMGYTRAANSSRRYGAKEDVLKINSSANVENGLNDYKLSSIVCISEKSKSRN